MNKTTCRSCGGNYLKKFLSLGNLPLANNLLSSMDETDELFPLELVYCKTCFNCQLSYVVPPEKMFSNYLYVSSTTSALRTHFQQAAINYINKFNLNDNSFVIDIGSNDGVFLKPLQERGVKVLGVEPASNIAAIALQNGIPTINDFFTSKLVDTITEKADIITASNVFAHADNIDDIINTAFKLLKPDGCFIVEVQYLHDTIKDLTFDNIYHEHVNYWTVGAMDAFCRRVGYVITDVEHIDTHGGSIRVYIQNIGHNVQPSVQKFFYSEKEFGLTNIGKFLEFAQRIETAKSTVNNNIKKFKDSGCRLVGYGAPAKATTSLNYYGVKDIDYIVEDNTLKHNKIVPGVRIPIYAKNKIDEIRPDIIVVMAWNFFNEIVSNNQSLINSGIRFVSIKDLQNEG